jgi:hypothetical protein
MTGYDINVSRDLLPELLGSLLRVHDLSGSVARHLSGRHSAPKGVPNETNGSATGEPKDEIRRNV